MVVKGMCSFNLMIYVVGEVYTGESVVLKECFPAGRQFVQYLAL